MEHPSIPKFIKLSTMAFTFLLCQPLSAQQEEEIDAEVKASQEAVLEELLVTGTFIKGLAQEDLASPIETLNRDEILNIGAFRIADIVNHLAINTGSENNPDAFTQNFTTGTSNINLRGLGVSSTLVLLNGRRQTFTAFATDKGENFVDTASLVPMIAIDRVEILKDGATSLYGSDAVAGVVNFHTRNNFEGSEVNVEFQSGSHGQQESTLSAIVGLGNGDTHFVGAFSIFNRDQVGTDSKRLSSVQDDTSRAGFPGTFLLPVAPSGAGAGLAPTWTTFFDSGGNVPGIADFFEGLLPGGTAVTGALRPGFSDPDCATLAATDNTTISPSTFPVGSCEFDFGSYFSLVPEEERTQLFANIDHTFSDQLDLNIELSYASNEASRRNSPSFPITSTPVVCGDPANPTTAQLDAVLGSSCAALGMHPDNPFGSTILFVGRVLGSGSPAATSVHNSDTFRIAATLNGYINDRWDWKASISQSDNEFYLAVDDTLASEFQLALVGYGGEDCAGPGLALPGVGDCMYFNPFGTSITGTGTTNSSAVMDYITGTLIIDAEASLQTIEGLVSGEIAEFENGPVEMAAGLQLRSEELNFNYDDHSNAENFLFTVGNPDFNTERDITAIFVEVAMPLSESLNLQLALRNEDYDNEFSSTDPKLGFLWRPTDNDRISIRGSYGSSFRAPSLFQQNGIQTNLVEIALVGQFLPVRAQPNPTRQLSPEEADIFNIGFSWRSESDNIDFSIDYWSFDYQDVLIQQDANAVVNAALVSGDTDALSQIVFQGGIVSATTIQRVNVYYDNASSLETNGIDVKASYHLPTDNGDFNFGLNLTNIMAYDLADPQLGAIDGLGSRNFNNFATSVPKTRSNLFAAWEKDNKHSANISIHTIGSYDDDQNGNTNIGSYTSVNVQYNYYFEPFTDADEGIKLTVGGINITDEDPPSIATNGGYDSKVHDPRGALYYIKASVPF